MLTIALMAKCHYVLAQGENKIWAFGNNNGINFNTGLPISITTSNTSSEGCAAVCNRAGSLLFYSNGNKVWNKSHIVMPNGTGILGNDAMGSSTQGVAIVPFVNDSTRYYLFVLSAAEIISGSSKGYLRYSVVDMKLNGGLGDVVASQKNIVLDSMTSEKLVVVKGNKCFKWLIVHRHDTTEFHAFKIGIMGIVPAPVVSYTGLRTEKGAYMYGEMKSSSDGSLIATMSNSPSTVELYDFNNATGNISNARQIDSFPTATIGYGVHFSPDNSRLYASTYDIFAASTKGLFQYNLYFLPSISMIKATRYVVNSSKVGYYGMRTGPDNKIYISTAGPGSSPETSKIDNPNGLALTCMFIPDIGIPTVYGFGNPVIPDYDKFDSVFHSTSQKICFDPVGILSATPGYDAYLWSTGDTLPTKVLTEPDTLWVYMNNGSCEVIIDTFKISKKPEDTLRIRVTVKPCLENPFYLSAPGGYLSYKWKYGDTTVATVIDHPDTTWLFAKGRCEVLFDTFNVVAKPTDSIFIREELKICFMSEDSVSISARPGYKRYLWEDGDTSQTRTFTQPDTLWVIARKECEFFTDTLLVSPKPIDTVRLKTEYKLCFTEPVPVSAAAGYDSYLWEDGDTARIKFFNTSDTLWVVSKKDCEIRFDTLQVIARPIDTIRNQSDIPLCFIKPSILYATAGYDHYLWDDGDTTNQRILSSPTLKWVIATKECDVLIDTFNVISKSNDTTYQVEDTAICFSTSITLTAPAGYATYLWNTGSTSPWMDFIPPQVKWVYADDSNCHILVDTFRTSLTDFKVLLSNKDSICSNEQIVLNATTPGATYSWQDGSEDSVYIADKPGTYSVHITVNGCTRFYTLTLRPHVLNIDLGADQLVCIKDRPAVQLRAARPAATYLWQDGAGTPLYNARESGTYWVEVKQGGCTSSDTVHIEFSDCDPKECLKVPTAFTPNADGLNDLFRIMPFCPVKHFHLTIMNRWGRVVFNTNDINEGWNGIHREVPLDAGTFYYMCEIWFDVPGTGPFKLKGDVTLIR